MHALCRLCAKAFHAELLKTNISELQTKLVICCGWCPLDNEFEMPTKVCDLCVDQLQMSWNFAESVSAAGNILTGLVQNQKIQINPKEKIEKHSNEWELETCFIKLEDNANDNLILEEPTVPNTYRSDDRAPIDVSQKSKNKRKPREKLAFSDLFLTQLDDCDHNVDGTISENGVAKLQKIFPEMTIMSWADCQYKCEKCDQVFKGPQNFVAHNRCKHKIRTMNVVCSYCNSSQKNERLLNKHIGDEHFKHLKYR